jgi:hypothetical protein
MAAIATHTAGQISPKAYTIPEFCRAYRLSESMYYKIRAAGLGPREMRALSKVTISVEAASDWRRERESTAMNSPMMSAV